MFRSGLDTLIVLGFGFVALALVFWLGRPDRECPEGYDPEDHPKGPGEHS